MNNVILIGMPGCGKSTVSQVFARKQGCRVYDTDAEITKAHGEISKIFEEHGEQYFRDLETQTLKKVCAEKGCIISVGGGCILREENVCVMKSDGNKVVYLKTRLSTLEGRLKNDTTRPLLKGNTAERLKKLFSERAQTYESVADVTIETDNLTAEEVFEKICFSLKN